MDIKTIEELNIDEKRVFIRLDLNVPMKDGVITDDTRIRGALPTIQYALKRKAKIVLASHLGRPKDTPEDREKYSLLAVGNRLSELLNIEVILFEDPVGEGIKGVLSGLTEKQVLLLENTRFVSGEEKNSMDMATNLASFTEVFINDAFGAIHRAHCTVAALPSLVKHRGIGFLIKKEVEMLDKLLHQAQHPFVAILGGAKVSDKMGVIDNLMDRVDVFVIGGAMAYTFLAAQDITVGTSLVEKDKIQLAKDLLKRFKNRGKKLILPIDHVVAKEFKAHADSQRTPTPAIPDGLMGLDIGPKTVALIQEELRNAKTVFWNGPMGAFETQPFEVGTFAVAKTLANITHEYKAVTIVGGGDSVTAVEAAGFTSQMTHISTGGGASLEYLEGQKLPGLEVLRQKGVDAVLKEYT
ncbi:MAG: phosphoglycerate kinase [Oligoflexia bacterium]|nr:phosphoglycerate kinase [Oligoflexia bacterium]